MLNFELVTLEGIKFRESVHEALLPTALGQIGVFTNHAPLVSLAAPGIVSLRRKPSDPDDFMEHFALSGGVIEIVDNTVRVLSDEATHSDEINEAEETAAHTRALKLQSEAKDNVSLEKAQSLIDRQAVRLKVAGLRRHGKHKR